MINYRNSNLRVICFLDIVLCTNIFVGFLSFISTREHQKDLELIAPRPFYGACLLLVRPTWELGITRSLDQEK